MKINSLKNAALAAGVSGFVMLLAGAPMAAQALDLGVGGGGSVRAGSSNTVHGTTGSVLNLGSKVGSDLDADTNTSVSSGMDADVNLNANANAQADADASVAARQAARAHHRAVVRERHVQHSASSNLDSALESTGSVNTQLDADVRASARVNE